MNASYGFSVFAIVLTVVVVGCMLALLIVLLVFNGITTLQVHLKENIGKKRHMNQVGKKISESNDIEMGKVRSSNAEN